MQTRRLMLFGIFAIWSLALAIAQPSDTWSVSYGGEGFEELIDLVVAPGGGTLAVGVSTSPTSGSLVRPAQGSEDVLVVRTARNGQILWEQRLGGTERDGAKKVIVDQEGRYIIAGYSYSSNDGNKQSIREAGGPWASDVWLICLDLAGNVVWDKSFGGINSEAAVGLTLAPNGNYMIAAYTDSPADANLSRKSPLKGPRCYWMLEVDRDGSLLGEYTYGGAQDDLTWGLKGLQDNTFLIYGASQSDASFDKTRPSYGSSDVWMLNVRQDGSIINDYQFGGDKLENPFVVEQYKNGDVFVAAQSRSGVSGNKTSPSLGDEVDVWALRFQLNSGRILWDKSYGGANLDDAYTSGINVNDYIILAGTTRSAERNTANSTIRGRDDAWIFYIAPTGEPIWDITRGGEGNESVRAIIRSEDGGWYLGGISNSDPFPWKDGPAYGTLFNGVRANDMWLAKLDCDFSVDLGDASLDVCSKDQIGLKNLNEPKLPHTSYFWNNGLESDSITLSGPDDMRITLVSVSPDACVAADSVTVDFHASPAIESVTIADVECNLPKSGVINLRTSAETLSFSLAGQRFIGQGIISGLDPGAYFVQLESTLPACNRDTTLIVKDAPSFSISLGDNIETQIGQTIKLVPQITDASTLQYQWSGYEDLCSDCPTQELQILRSVEITLIATDSAGCTSQASISIRAIKVTEIGRPNIFSPNDDGVNDKFVLYPPAYVKTLGPLQMYDRWGNMVFSGSNDALLVGQGWDGTFRGQKAAPGVYTYICPVEFLDGTTELIEAEVALIR